MKLKFLFDLISRKEPDRGYWVGSLRCATLWWDKHLSLGGCFKRWALQHYKSRAEGKAQAWVAELYTSFVFLVAVIALLAARPLEQLCVVWGISLGLLTVVWPTFRGLEIFFLLLRWVFVDTAKLHSVQRSLIGFILNIAELSCLFASIGISIGSKQPAGKGQIFVDGMVDLIKMSHHDPISLSVGGILEAIRIFFGVMLILVIVGSLAGGVARRTLVDDE